MTATKFTTKFSENHSHRMYVKTAAAYSHKEKQTYIVVVFVSVCVLKCNPPGLI